MSNPIVVEEFKNGVNAFRFAGFLAQGKIRCKLFKQSGHWYVTYYSKKE